MKSNKTLASAFLATSLLAFSLPAFVPQVRAGGCFEDLVYERSGQVKVVIGARVRSVACMEGSVVLKTLPVGRVVQLIGETDGWLKIRDADGVEGWVGAQLLAQTNEPVSQNTNPAPATQPTPTTQPTTQPSTVSSAKLRGYILLQVENHGEAWYVNPADGKRYYMKDGPTAYQMMRLMSLGISNADFAKLQAGNATMVANLKGKIMLKVEDLGKAYYVHPVKGTLHYLRDGEAAYTVMRELSLGITNTDLNRIPSATLNVSTGTSTPAPTTPAPTPAPGVSFQAAQPQIGASAFQQGSIPEGIDLVELNRYWLTRINALRAARDLRQLVLDQRWVNTATEYAAYMGQNHVTGHERADGSTMHQWIDTKGLQFTVRNSPDGWKTNYFTENISWNQIAPTMEAAKRALDETIEFYLAEESTNGAHYRTIYYPDWNSVGAGFYFEPVGSSQVKIYQVFHYGSLEM